MNGVCGTKFRVAQAQPNAHTQVAATGGESGGVRRGKRKWTLTTTIACYLQCEIPAEPKPWSRLSLRDGPCGRGYRARNYNYERSGAASLLPSKTRCGAHHCHDYRLENDIINSSSSRSSSKSWSSGANWCETHFDLGQQKAFCFTNRQPKRLKECEWEGVIVCKRVALPMDWHHAIHSYSDPHTAVRPAQNHCMLAAKQEWTCMDAWNRLYWMCMCVWVCV